MINSKKIGSYIQELRKNKSLTQIQLGDRLNVSFQAVSKWERGESLPEAALLPQLANILDTSIDNILNGGKILLTCQRKISPQEIKRGIDQLGNIGNLIGKDTRIYLGLVKGINQELKIDFEEYISDSFNKEALIAEIIVHNLASGADIDISETREVLQHEQWYKTVVEYANKFGTK